MLLAPKPNIFKYYYFAHCIRIFNSDLAVGIKTKFIFCILQKKLTNVQSKISHQILSPKTAPLAAPHPPIWRCSFTALHNGKTFIVRAVSKGTFVTSNLHLCFAVASLWTLANGNTWRCTSMKYFLSHSLTQFHNHTCTCMKIRFASYAIIHINLDSDHSLSCFFCVHTLANSNTCRYMYKYAINSFSFTHNNTLRLLATVMPSFM